MSLTQTANRQAQSQTAVTSESEDWHALHQEKCPQARNRLIEKHMLFAKILAAKLFANRVIREADFDDYRQWGIEGLIEAIDRFDPCRGVPFEAYAAKRIQGAILNQVDTLSDRAAQISMRARIRRERVQSMGEQVDLHGDVNVLFNQLAEVAVGMALGVLLEDTGMVQPADELSTNTDAYRSVELAQLRERIHALVELLPERERMVVKYHYYFCFSFEQIGQQLELTRGRISQIHQRALHRLRDMQQQTSSLNLHI